jgi:signal transduction histidine kinase
VRLSALARLANADGLAIVFAEQNGFRTYVAYNLPTTAWNGTPAASVYARVHQERAPQRLGAVGVTLADGRNADTLLAAPIVWNEQSAGVLASFIAGRATSEDELRQLARIADLVAVELADANALWRAQRAAHDADMRLRAALDFQRAATSGMESALFDRATAWLVETFGADGVSIMLLDEAGDLSVASARGLSDEARKTRKRIGEGISGRVALSGRPVLLTGQVEGGNDPAISESMVAPLRTGERTLGVVSVRHRSLPARYAQPQLDALAATASDLASAMVLARELDGAQEDRRHAIVLYELSRFATLGTDAQADLDSAVAMIAGAMHHDAVGIWEVAELRLRLRASTGYAAVLPSEVVLDEADTDLATVLREHRTTRASFAPGADRPDWAAPGSASFVLAPIGTLGVLVLGRATGGYRDAEADFAATVADYLVGMLHKQSGAGAVERGIASERRKIAQEIHDGLAQELTGVVLALEGCQRALEKDPALLKPQLAKTARDARATLADVRQYMSALRQSETGALNLPVTLGRLVDDLRRQSGLNVEMEESGTQKDLSPIVERAVIRIVGESLRNVAQHAGANSAKVVLLYGPEEIIVTIEDDGKGFDVDQVYSTAEQTGHFGVVGMRERAEAAGGQLVVRSEPERGTIVRATIPYAPAGAPMPEQTSSVSATVEDYETSERSGFLSKLLRR